MRGFVYMKRYLQEFREFAVRGNVIDLAVAVIIGGAFGKIVSSLVADIIMPLIGLIIGGVDFTSWRWTLSSEDTMNIGIFLQNIFYFLIIALAIFFMIKLIGRLKKKIAKEQAEPLEEKTPAAPTKDQELLAEIRDLLKK